MNREYAWAIVRLILGLLQIVGATMAVFFYFRTGVGQLTVWAAVVTGIVTLTSKLLFRHSGTKR